MGDSYRNRRSRSSSRRRRRRNRSETSRSSSRGRSRNYRSRRRSLSRDRRRRSSYSRERIDNRHRRNRSSSSSSSDFGRRNLNGESNRRYEDRRDDDEAIKNDRNKGLNTEETERIRKRRERLAAWKAKRKADIPNDSHQVMSNNKPEEDEKIKKRKAKLLAWKRKQGLADIKQEERDVKTLEEAGNEVPKGVRDQEIDPLDAFLKEQAQESKKAIQEALEKEKKEAEIVAKGGHIEEPSGEVFEDELQKLAQANKRCYVCKKFGHTKAECPVKRCLFCFEVGHVQKDCAKYTEELKRQAEEEKKRKRQKFYQEKKNRRREERLQKLRIATGIYGFQELYKILDLPTNKLATQADIKKAFQKQSLLWHPDKHATKTEEERAKVEEKYGEIRDAYDLLLEGLERGNLEGRAVGKAGDLADQEFVMKWYIEQNMKK